MAKKDVNSKQLSYQALSSELEAIVQELQADEQDVDTALERYERGLELIKQLDTYLKTAEIKVTELKAKFSK